MTARAPSPTGPAATLAGRLCEIEAPDALVRARSSLAASVSEDTAKGEPVVAAVVVGSTALRRCSPGADLDLAVITPGTPGADRFATRWVDGVRVEIERVGRREALARTRGEGWVWQLREAARLGCGVPVLDPHGFGARLARRAETMAPAADRYEATLRGVYLALVDLARRPRDHAHPMEALRGCLDNLALLALLDRPRRYQKPKWALADLLHAGEVALADAVLAAYGITGDDAPSASAAVAGAHDVVALAFDAAGIPPHGEILAMGHTPEWAEASYVSRTLADAEDLAASGRSLEAQYVAKLAARLAAGVLSPTAAAPGIVEAFAARAGDALATRYLALFDDHGQPPAGLLDTALASADDRRRRLAAHPRTARTTAVPG